MSLAPLEAMDYQVMAKKIFCLKLVSHIICHRARGQCTESDSLHTVYKETNRDVDCRD